MPSCTAWESNIGVCLAPGTGENQRDHNFDQKKMKRFKVVATVCCIAFMSAILSPAAIADDSNRKIVVTQPIKLVDAPVLQEPKRAPIMAIQPTGENVQLAQVVTPMPAVEPKVVAALAPAAREMALAATASQVPLIFVFGMLFLGAAVSIRAVAKRFR